MAATRPHAFRPERDARRGDDRWGLAGAPAWPPDAPPGAWRAAGDVRLGTATTGVTALAVLLGLVLAPAVGAAVYLRAVGPTPAALLAVGATLVAGGLGLGLLVRTLRGAGR
jgi:hypothetical protein